MKLILLPGLNGTAELFAPLIAALGEQIETRVIEYPPDAQLGYPELTTLVRSALPENEAYVLLGESFSGPISVTIASERPEGLVGLILCNTFVTSPSPLLSILFWLPSMVPAKFVPHWLLGWLVRGRTHCAALEQIINVIKGLAPQLISSRLRAIGGMNVTTALHSVNVPLLIFRGKFDAWVPASSSKLIEAHIPDTRLVELATAHFLLQSAPVVAAQAIKDFLRIHEPSDKADRRIS